MTGTTVEKKKANYVMIRRVKKKAQNLKNLK